VHRWAIKLLPVLGKAFGRRKRPVGKSWRVDASYIKVKGAWKYLYRAVDKAGHTIDFLLRAHRDKAAEQRYFEKSIDQNGEPETITIDKSGSNLAALEALNAQPSTPIKIRQNKYLNNIIEQDHRAIKRRTVPCSASRHSVCRHSAGRHRTDAYDKEGPDDGHWPNCCRSVLLGSQISTAYHIAFAVILIATEPDIVNFLLGSKMSCQFWSPPPM
jgi:DDE domain